MHSKTRVLVECSHSSWLTTFTMVVVEIDHTMVVRLVLDYLRQTNCVKAMRALEEETSVMDEVYGEVNKHTRCHQHSTTPERYSHSQLRT